MVLRARRRRGVAADDLYALRFVADAQISPDGTQVAYVVAWVEAADHTRYRSQLMLVPTDGSSRPRPLTMGLHRDTAPRWAPDGRSLAFLSDRDGARPQLFHLSLLGGEPRQMTWLKRGAGTPVWSPDGTRIVFSARVDIADIAAQEGQRDDARTPPRVRVITRVRHKSDGEGFAEALHRHLFVQDVRDPGAALPRQITDGDWDDTDPAWSPDGSQLVFVANRERDRDLSMLSDVWLVAATGGRAKRLTRHRGQAATPAFAPDGSQVAYIGHERGWTYGVPAELLTVSTAGGESEAIAPGFPDDIGNVALSDARDPVAAAPPQWLADGSALLALVSRGGCVEVLRFPVGGGSPRVVLGGPREIAACSATPDGRRLAATVSDSTHPYEVVTLVGTTERTISHENDRLLDALDVRPAEPIAVRASDGVAVHGWVIKPPGFTERRSWPLVLEIHGGPETMYAATFMHEFQVLAARGYVVVFSNPRGSKGYGEPFAARIFADWGNQDAADCLSIAEAAATWRGIDPARLGVTGGSYGGFMTGWLLGHSRRFRAAVAQRGLFNFVSFYGTSDIGPTFGEYVLGGPAYERDQLYRRCSPLTYAAEITTPLLLIHSEQDLRCPIEQAEQMFVHLRRLGRAPVEFIRFPEESHNLSRSGRPDRRVERLERIAGWFDQHL